MDVIPIPGTDATVTMKSEATYEDELEVTAALPAGVEPRVFHKLYIQARTIVMIESWTLKQEDGTPLPCNEDSLIALPRKVGSFIADEARKRYQGEDDAPLGTPSQPPSQETTSTTRK